MNNCRREKEDYVATHLISIMVRRCDLYRCRQIEDDSLLSESRLTPRSFYGVAYFNGKVGFRLRECFRAVLKLELCSVFF